MKTSILQINTTLVICTISLFALFASGCKKDDKTNPKPVSTVTGPYLYVGGAANNKGVYWKTSLSATTPNAVADSFKNTNAIYSLITSGKDVYVAGQTAGYYKNDVFVPVTGATGIQYLALSGTTVFAAGADNTANIGYWQSSTETNLSNTIASPLFTSPGTSVLGLSGIAVSGSKVYVTGKLFYEARFGSPANALSGSFGTLWTNGGLQLYGPGQLVSAYYNSTAGIALVGNDVYVAGRLPDSTYAGGYWKNGTFNAINNGSFGPTAITSSGNDVYITGYTFVRAAGTYSQQGAYWKNGALISFPGASSTTAIAVNGTDVYILGIDNNNNNVVWKNGAVFETLGSAVVQTASSIAIGN
ncbi:hypothetical protein HDF24_18985 [Mucilaginibacter sp. X4EP1]|uniref:hypothetical protein n=1 Tax=Mucilaginibacter sp. X4EP1 TaxID=2723092 RepID=UPI00216A1443|nr:hypothetical protein [Mucilaginibacter sp. X4EP1]MCS3813341.1 hypothetical protein [Mucilaginibacter sp. X4EP1]